MSIDTLLSEDTMNLIEQKLILSLCFRFLKEPPSFSDAF